MTPHWQRGDVELDQLWTPDAGDDPLIYRVVGLIDSPVVVLRPLRAEDGEDEEYHVIGSANFAAWKRLDRTEPS